MDSRFSEVVAHALEGFGRCGDAPNRHGERCHEIDQPAEERSAFEKVVMALDEGGSGLEPCQRFDLPLALGCEPAPDAGPRGEPVCSIGLEDDEGVGHGVRNLTELKLAPTPPPRRPTGVAGAPPAAGSPGLAGRACRPCGPSASRACAPDSWPLRLRSRVRTGSRGRSPSIASSR